MTLGWMLAALLGAAVGHGIRRGVPAVLGLRDRSMPVRWPLIEAVTAVAFAIVVWRSPGLERAWPLLVLTSLLIATSATDYLVKLIPDRLTLPGTALGVLAAAISSGALLESPLHRFVLALLGLEADRLGAGVLALAGALVGFTVLQVIRMVFGALAGLEVMGMGDSKLAMMAGAFLGPAGIAMALMLGFFLGVVHGGVMLKVTGLPHSPFGPPLAAAAWIAALARTEVLAALGAAQRAIVRLPLGVLAVAYTVLITIAVALVVRTRRRAAEYHEMIEEDYRAIDEQLED